MPNDDSTNPVTQATQDKQRRVYARRIIFALVAMGSLMVITGYRGMSNGELELSNPRKPGVGKTDYMLDGAEARVFSGSLLAMGTGFLLTLVFLPRITDPNLFRTGIFQLPLWQLGLLAVVVMLVAGGVIGLIASFAVE